MRQTQLEIHYLTGASIRVVTVEDRMAKSHKAEEMGKCQTTIMTSRSYSRGMYT
jgi:hypothetical protein